MKFKILRFINSNPNWRAILSSSPYNLIIKDLGDCTLIKYNQLFSDFKEPMVREARGIIIQKKGRKYRLVRIAFTKFFCAGDPNAKRDLYKLAHRKQWFVEEKIDGSLITLAWWDNKWHVSTSGNIDAYKAPLSFANGDIQNFGKLFEYASKGKIDYKQLNKRFTYIFELVGLENKVVVPYEVEDIYYLGRRNNNTLLEVPYFKDNCAGVEDCKRPKCRVVDISKNPKKIIKELQREVNSFTKDQEHFEGYVISDSSLKTRVKMKSSKYLELSSQKGDGVFSARKILLMIKDHKDDDVLSSFPEYKPQFDDIRNKLSNWMIELKNDIDEMKSLKFESRKDLAMWAKEKSFSSILFAAYNTENSDMDWIEKEVYKIKIDNLLMYIGVRKDDKENV